MIQIAVQLGEESGITLTDHRGARRNLDDKPLFQGGGTSFRNTARFTVGMDTDVFKKFAKFFSETCFS